MCRLRPNGRSVGRGWGSDVAVEIKLLGDFEVRCDGRTILDARSRPTKGTAIVKILALRPNRAIARDELIELLWPEADVEAGLSSFYKNVHQLRRVLSAAGAPPDFVRSERGRVALEGAQVDVDAFTAASREGIRLQDVRRLEEASALFRGELLADDRYADWAARRGSRRTGWPCPPGFAWGS